MWLQSKCTLRSDHSDHFQEVIWVIASYSLQTWEQSVVFVDINDRLHFSQFIQAVVAPHHPASLGLTIKSHKQAEKNIFVGFSASRLMNLCEWSHHRHTASLQNLTYDWRLLQHRAAQSRLEKTGLSTMLDNVDELKEGKQNSWLKHVEKLCLPETIFQVEEP